MSNLDHVLCNSTTTSQHFSAIQQQAGHLPALCIVLVTATNDETIAAGSHGPARQAVTVGNPEVHLTNEALSQAANHAAGPPVTQRSATIGHPTPKKGEAQLITNSAKE